MRVFGSLSNRIFLASALLAALSIGAALFFVRARLTAETQQALEHDLQTAANIADQQQAALFDTFTRSARLLADLPRFKAAVDTGDAPTVQPIAEEYLREHDVGVGVFFIAYARATRYEPTRAGMPPKTKRTTIAAHAYAMKNPPTRSRPSASA